MNRIFFLLAGVCLSFLATAQTDYRVVFDLTSKDSADQRAAVRWLNEIIKANPEAKMEVVMFGQGIPLVLKGKSAMPDDVVKLIANKNVSFKVCQVAMNNNGIDKSQLFPGVEIVPDGIYEVISKQRQGWGYIKVKI
jgi:intracellular sulfur oxidation DsrE/DsrF family protein